METDSSELATRSPLGIDLNEIPSSSSPSSVAVSESVPAPTPTQPVLPNPEPSELDSLDVVRSFHENQDPASGIAARLPREQGLPTCGACGKPEVRGHVVVCDGCERGFHITCAGMHGRQAMNLVDWICGECVSGGVKSKRWPLGVKSKRILDINASPPSDCDGDGESSEERVNLRKHTLVGNSSSRDAFVAPVTYSNLVYARNGFGPFDCRKGSGLMMKAFRVGFEDILHHAQTVDSSLEEIDLGFPLGRLRSTNNTAIRLPSRSPNEILLQGLREFISERHGMLDEGWHVELKHSMTSYEVYAVYCSPDGKTFGSMSEVACYLGLTPNCNSIDSDKRSDGSPLQERLHLPKRRKSKRSSLANGFTENKQALVNGYHKDLLSNGQSTEIGDTQFGKVGEADAEEDDITKSLSSDEELPVQFEDFFVISLGKIDARPSYHDTQLIWPVGYRSCWHDKVTGSLFVCEVLDGGDSGPVFKVRRFSCSVLPVPEGSSVLCRKNSGQFAGQKSKEYNDTICHNMDYDEDGTVEMILADASPPTEDDILTCLDHSSNGTYGVQTTESLQSSSSHSRAGNFSSCDLGLGDEIGEISAEECSSSSAWRMVSQKLIDAYSEICNRKGILKLYCKHVNNEIGSLTCDEDKKSSVGFASLAKFCSSPGSFGMPLEYEGEVDNLAAALSKWLDQDRFGLDTDFVQEIIEQLPGVGACPNYEFLFNRGDYSESQTVGNGLLMAKRKNGADLDDLFQRSKKPRLGKDCGTGDHPPPPGGGCAPSFHLFLLATYIRYLYANCY
ncbi:hypothetical protein GH714_041399 [Hevea brasiliensis]|uniref:PHD-type domain-containing protein n=1 Tax=Hevea brasiliensis TaxID=3981 RepID=A0A6A6MQH3_HEVBR|nr:hypothetical protein GH714_041399 [Hevea brasiliensis]